MCFKHQSLVSDTCLPIFHILNKVFLISDCCEQNLKKEKKIDEIQQCWDITK